LPPHPPSFQEIGDLAPAFVAQHTVVTSCLACRTVGAMTLGPRTFYPAARVAPNVSGTRRDIQGGSIPG
jgi:hypothetical protein